MWQGEFRNFKLAATKKAEGKKVYGKEVGESQPQGLKISGEDR